MATTTTITSNSTLDLPWHMVIDQVSHELGFSGCDIYDIIVEAEAADFLAERDSAPEDLKLEQA